VVMSTVPESILLAWPRTIVAAAPEGPAGPGVVTVTTLVVSLTGTLTSSGLTPTAGSSGIGPGDAGVRVGVGLPVSWSAGIVGRVSRRDSPCHRPDLVVAVSKR